MALKGLGGFQFIVDVALDDAVVKRLRERKHRSEKPLASSCIPRWNWCLRGLPALAGSKSAPAGLSPEAPSSVLLKNRWSPPLAPSIAPGNPNLGSHATLTTPLHHLFLRELGFSVEVPGHQRQPEVTNPSAPTNKRLRGSASTASPICFSCTTARLSGPWTIPVVRVMRGREMVLRRARGYAPLATILTCRQQPATPLDRACSPILGAHLKNTVVALSVTGARCLHQPAHRRPRN